jgi:exopolysaccharide biosynthesis polyprenyl glycosylphosphotransferase
LTPMADMTAFTEPVAAVPDVRVAAGSVPEAVTGYRADHGRLGLQRRATSNVRQHLRRAVVRVSVLAVADVACVWLVRAGARLLNDPAVVGPSVARAAVRWLPVSYLEGWAFTIAILLSMLVLGTYRQGDPRSEPRRIFGATCLATALSLWAEIWSVGLGLVFVQYAVLTGVFSLVFITERLLIDRVVVVALPRRRLGPRAVLVGTRDEFERLLERMASHRMGKMHIVGYVGLDGERAPGMLGTVEELSGILGDQDIESVILGNSLQNSRFGKVADVVMAAGCALLSVPRSIDLPGTRPQVVWHQHQPLLQLNAPAMLGTQLVVKRLLDLVLSLAGIIVLSPLLLLVAVAVKLDSHGPVFFSQVRVGKGGRRFRMLKFRTMVRDAEDLRDQLAEHSVYGDGRLFKIREDPRVTRLGRLLRRTSVDELPQLINVLLGQMSLVGPRPPLPSEVALYEEHHYARFDMKPGITGPWQVNGRNEMTDFERVVELETAYIRGWWLGSDLRILLLTVPAVLRMRGAH